MKRRRNKILKNLFLLWSMFLAFCFSFSALAAQESEDNGTFGRADVISLGEKVTGNVSTPGDEDFFKFTVSKKGKITIKEYFFTTPGYDGFDSTTLHLYDGNRRAIYEQKDGAMTNQSISVTPGTYYVRITQRGMYGKKIPYGFKISFSQGKGTYRIDDFSSFQKARTIGVGSKVYGNIATSTECDYYKFTLPQAGIVELTGARAVSGNDYLLWKSSLYNAKKEKIDAGIDYSNKVRVGLAAGTYYIKVTRDEKWSKKKYYLMVEYKKTNVWEKELNDTFDRSTPISLNSYVYGSMNTWSDVDCYTFTMPEDGTVKFDLSMDRSICYATLYGSNYRQSSGLLINSAPDWDGNETAPTVSPTKGTYYLKLSIDYLMAGDPALENYHFRVRTSVQPASIKLNKTSVTLSLPGTTTVQLKATVTGASKKVTWKSSNTSVATVSTSGKVTAKKAGTAIITATANGKSAKCTVTVKDSKTANAKAEYLKYLQRSEKEKVKFAIRDVFGDGTPELITIQSYGHNISYRPIIIQWYDPSFAGEDEYAGRHHLQTLNLNGAVEIYVNKSKKYYIEYASGESGGYAVRKLPSGEIIKSFWSYSSGGKRYYKASGTGTSVEYLTKEQWEAQLREYMKNCVCYREATLALYTNNATNRNRVLK